MLTDQRNFTANHQDILSLLRQLNVSTALYEYVQDSNKLKGSILPPFPGVKTYCIYGTSVETVHTLDFRGKKFPDEQPSLINVAGDGTVAHPSLSLCHNWNLGPEGIIEIPNASHTGVLQGTKGINAVIQILSKTK